MASHGFTWLHMASHGFTLALIVFRLSAQVLEWRSDFPIKTQDIIRLSTRSKSKKKQQVFEKLRTSSGFVLHKMRSLSAGV